MEQDMTNTLLLAVPATAYNFQMKLEYVALANLNAAIFSVLVQTKLLCTAIMAYAVLRKKLKYIQIISLTLLTVGVMLCNLSGSSSSSSGSSSMMMDSATLTGVMATLGIAMSSGFASVYTEKVIKANRSITVPMTTPSITIPSTTAITAATFDRSEYGLAYTQVQLAFMSICTIGLYALWQDLDKILEFGLFYQFSYAAMFSVLNSAIGGLIVASVLKYADSVLKGYATAMSVILTGIFSMILFNTSLSIIYFLGIVNVVTAVLLYNGKDLDQMMC
jgi:solute carrier family 35 (UDP-sugar transporter), member A1/2/3